MTSGKKILSLYAVNKKPKVRLWRVKLRIFPYFFFNTNSNKILCHYQQVKAAVFFPWQWQMFMQSTQREKERMRRKRERDFTFENTFYMKEQ